MKWIRKVLVFFLWASTSACSLIPLTEIAPVTGRVIDQDTGQPIENAIVVVRWIGTGTKAFVDQHTECYHVETATTDGEGRYSISAWLEASEYRDLGLKGNIQAIYKSGYDYGISEGKVHYLVRDRGSVENRFDFLDDIASSVNCFEAKQSQRNLYRLREAVYYEAKELGATPELLQRLRELAANAWLADDPETPWGEHKRKVEKFLEEHLR